MTTTSTTTITNAGHPKEDNCKKRNSRHPLIPTQRKETKNAAHLPTARADNPASDSAQRDKSKLRTGFWLPAIGFVHKVQCSSPMWQSVNTRSSKRPSSAYQDQTPEINIASMVERNHRTYRRPLSRPVNQGLRGIPLMLRATRDGNSGDFIHKQCEDSGGTCWFTIKQQLNLRGDETRNWKQFEGLQSRRGRTRRHPNVAIGNALFQHPPQRRRRVSSATERLRITNKTLANGMIPHKGVCIHFNSNTQSQRQRQEPREGDTQESHHQQTPNDGLIELNC